MTRNEFFCAVYAALAQAMAYRLAHEADAQLPPYNNFHDMVGIAASQVTSDHFRDEDVKYRLAEDV